MSISAKLPHIWACRWAQRADSVESRVVGTATTEGTFKNLLYCTHLIYFLGCKKKYIYIKNYPCAVLKVNPVRVFGNMREL